MGILQRHIKSSERGQTFEELVEMTRGSPRRSVEMMVGRLEFTQLGEFNLSKSQNSHWGNFQNIFLKMNQRSKVPTLHIFGHFDRKFRFLKVP